jgi:hypothetical protein
MPNRQAGHLGNCIAHVCTLRHFGRISTGKAPHFLAVLQQDIVF